MKTDRYLRIILTIIAIELLWIGLRDLAPAVSSAGRADSRRHRERGRRISACRARRPDHGCGAKSAATGSMGISGDVSIKARTPLKIEADRPLKVEADRPLKVESVPYTPGARPGE